MCWLSAMPRGDLQLLIEQEIGQLRTICCHHLAECGNLASQVALTLVLLIEELAGEVIDELLEINSRVNREIRIA